jgi:acyl-CoA thioesterase I
MSSTLLPLRTPTAATRSVVVHTFGDSILDCGHYNAHGVHPGQLLVSNDDRLFPAFRGMDLQSRGPARLVHRAVDGATVAGLASQLAALDVDGMSDAMRQPDDPARLALLTVGGNDLIRGLAADSGAGLRAFERTLQSFLDRLPIRPVLVGTVYDPTFGDDDRNFLGVPPRIARANHRRVNDILREAAERHGKLADIHAHFLRGDPSWYTSVIEPSLLGASEVRRVFLSLV